MIAWWWLIPFTTIGGVLGYLIQSTRAEREEFRQQQQRDDEWDARFRTAPSASMDPAASPIQEDDERNDRG